jgi:hypothetical protein
MSGEQEKRIADLIEALDYDEYEVETLFAEFGFLGFIFPEDIEEVDEEDAGKILEAMEERCLE